MPPLTEAAPAGATERLAREIARRRTFAIISHPDAGKTTLTEKLLLYAGAVELAGAVRARGNQRRATSDWMSMEQERGISITATALEMEYQGYHINLLDTPGHQDFSEDTYRTLTAVDSVVMVLDSAKGIEPQTEKLFHVCRLRGIPILTFINKMDHAGRDPLELLDEIERILGIATAPLNWPIGSGPWFQGVYDLVGRQVLRFERSVRGQRPAPVTVTGLDDPALPGLLGDSAYRELCEGVELVEGAGSSFDRQRFLDGAVTPVFFGSALNNFGIEPFLEALLDLAPPPGPRDSDRGPVQPEEPTFTGFVFKVQANMDPRHRDRMAFLRVCSGRFEKDMQVLQPRLGRNMHLSRVFRLFGRDRQPIEEAYPGDVIGVVSPGLLTIGDTVTAGPAFRFTGIPRFAPEYFGTLLNRDVTRYKQFQKGLEQLEEEGAIQVFYSVNSSRHEPILAAMGQLQFDVVLSRLRDEYGVEATIQPMELRCARWVTSATQASGDITLVGRGAVRCLDRSERTVLLFRSTADLEYYQRQNPSVNFLEMADIA